MARDRTILQNLARIAVVSYVNNYSEEMHLKRAYIFACNHHFRLALRSRYSFYVTIYADKLGSTDENTLLLGG